MDSSFISVVVQGGAVGLAAFALFIVWQQIKVSNVLNRDMIDVIKTNSETNSKVANAVESNTEAVKSLGSIIQNKF